MSEKNKKPLSLAAVALLALLALALIIGLSRIPIDGLTGLLSLLFSRGDDALTPEQMAYETILAEMALPETVSPPSALDSLSLTEAFSQFAFADHYTHTYTVTYTDGNRTLTQCISLSRQGDAFKIALYEGTQPDPAALLRTGVHDGSTYQVEDNMGNSRLYVSGEDFPLASVAMLPDPDLFCDKLAEYERNPDASPFSDCAAVVSDTANGRLLTLRFTERATGSEEIYRYLLDYGILFDATSTRDGLLYYRLSTLAYSDGSGDDRAE
ncbi:MAG: hypothetical protein IKD37_09440 [Clostridia bacterium]|nr:hypothetical protein [Clostridia bacterium]